MVILQATPFSLSTRAISFGTLAIFCLHEAHHRNFAYAPLLAINRLSGEREGAVCKISTACPSRGCTAIGDLYVPSYSGSGEYISVRF